MTTLEQARTDVQNAFDTTIDFCLSRESSTITFDLFEKKLWSMLLGLGRTFVVLFLVRRAAASRTGDYKTPDGRTWFVSGPLTEPLGTLFGVVSWRRPVGRLAGQLRGMKCDRFVDRELGLVNGFSLGVVQRMVWLSALMAYQDARKMFAQFHGWSVCSRSQQRFIDALGALARTFFNEQGAPAGDGEVIVVQADAGAAPHISPGEMKRRTRPRRKEEQTDQEANERHRRRAKRRGKPRRRRSAGQKSKNGKAAFIGVVYTLRRTSNGLEGPLNKRIMGTFESHEALFKLIRHEVDRRGKNKPVFFLADGSEHLWRMQQKYLPEAQCCLDWWHLVEKFWDVARCLYGKQSRARKAWVDRMKGLLRRGSVGKVLSHLQELLDATPMPGPGNKAKRERLVRLLKYMTEHRSRLRYREFRRMDMDIGTGLVEAAVRTVVRQRLDCSGMKWGLPRSECVLWLRCIALNNQWEDFVDHIRTKGVKLAARPVPAVPHAVKQKAA